MTLVDQIREMISAGETEKSLEELYKFVKENNADIIDNLVMLRSRMQSVERAVNVGTMSSQEATLEKAKINDAILKLLPQLTPEYLAEASKRKTTAPPASAPYRPAAPVQNNNKLYMIIGGLGGALLLIILLIVWVNGCVDTENSSDLALETQQLVESEPADHEQPAATILDELLAKNGTATWEATVDYVSGEDILASFVFHDNQSCTMTAEGENGGTFKVVENTSDHVKIYLSEAGTGVYIILYKTIAKAISQETGEAKIIYEGAWK